MNATHVAAAIRQAANDGRDLRFGERDGKERKRHVAIGDPQAPLATFFSILEAHGLLTPAGRLHDDVHLVSIGDHFDYGPPAWRRWATQESFELLAWLASHSADQVTILLGNHDLVRVDQMAGFDAATYERARADADRAYNFGERVEALERAFVSRWPQFADSEAVARDYSSFSVLQRGLVTRLLREDRARLAYAHHDRLLLVHAGVTRADLQQIGAPADDARAIARALNDFCAAAVSRWQEGPFDLKPLHRAGSAALGSPRGCFTHRPAHPGASRPDEFFGPPRRRYDPRDLPALTQVIGHIRDDKCRSLLGDWVADGANDAPEGLLRSLTVAGDVVRYSRGVQPQARLIFIDGGMNHVSPDDYQLLDLDTGQPLALGAATSNVPMSGT